MSRRQVLSGLLAAGLTGGASACASDGGSPPPDPPVPRRQGPQPNIVFIMLDDAGWGDVGPHSDSMIQTPNIDRIANEGMRFNQMYAGSSVCSPSRAALLTGRYPTRVGIESVIERGDRKGLSRYERTLAGLLRSAGYRTGIFGKWHLGNRPRHNPVRHGFDRFVGLLHSNDQRPLWLYEGQQVIQQEVAQSTLSRTFTDEAITFLEANQREPVFLYVPYTAPHIPLQAEPGFAGKSPAGEYGDVLQNVDFHIGRLLDKIDELGLTEDTIVVFTSDNGPWFQGSAGPLRGGKTTCYEGGVRVPFFVRWPKRVRPGSHCDETASFLDMVPTLVGIGGGDVPRDRPMDGLDIGAVLTGQPMPAREALYFFDRWELAAVRSGPWKLHLPDPRTRHKNQLRQLFNIELDPGERYDQAQRNPGERARLEWLAKNFASEIARQRPVVRRRSR